MNYTLFFPSMAVVPLHNFTYPGDPLRYVKTTVTRSVNIISVDSYDVARRAQHTLEIDWVIRPGRRRGLRPLLVEDILRSPKEFP